MLTKTMIIPAKTMEPAQVVEPPNVRFEWLFWPLENNEYPFKHLFDHFLDGVF